MYCVSIIVIIMMIYCSSIWHVKCFVQWIQQNENISNSTHFTLQNMVNVIVPSPLFSSCILPENEPAFSVTQYTAESLSGHHLEKLIIYVIC